MGIEPTNRMLSIRPNGFEDRAGHQPWFHFQISIFKWQLSVASSILYTNEQLSSMITIRAGRFLAQVLYGGQTTQTTIRRLLLQTRQPEIRWADPAGRR